MVLRCSLEVLTCVGPCLPQRREYGEGYESFILDHPAARRMDNMYNSGAKRGSSKSVRNVRGHPFSLVVMNQLLLLLYHLGDRMPDIINVVTGASNLLNLLPVPYEPEDPNTEPFVLEVRVVLLPGAWVRSGSTNKCCAPRMSRRLATAHRSWRECCRAVPSRQCCWGTTTLTLSSVPCSPARRLGSPQPLTMCSRPSTRWCTPKLSSTSNTPGQARAASMV